MSKDKDITLFDDIEWGNKTLPGLSHEEIMSSHVNIIVNNRNRKDSKEWQKVIKKRRKPVLTEKQRKAKSERTKKLWQDPEYYEYMQSLRDDKWIEKMKKANANPVRNKKISKANSIRVQTPDGIFKNAMEASKHYNITAEGIRHRIKTKEDWLYLDAQPTKPKAKSKKQNAASRLKRLTAIAEKNGYVYTPYGKFLSVREAWREEQKYNDVIPNAHVWFKEANKNMPTKYYKKVDTKL